MPELCFATNLSSGEMASWVQAIGAIVAILSSAMIVYWQVNRQAKDARSAEVRRAQEASRDALIRAEKILRFAANTLEQIRGQLSADEHIDTGVPLDLLTTSAARISEAIASIDPATMPTAEALFHLLSGAHEFEKARPLVDDAIAYRTAHPETAQIKIHGLKTRLIALRSEADALHRQASLINTD